MDGRSGTGATEATATAAARAPALALIDGHGEVVRLTETFRAGFAPEGSPHLSIWDFLADPEQRSRLGRVLEGRVVRADLALPSGDGSVAAEAEAVMDASVTRHALVTVPLPDPDPEPRPGAEVLLSDPSVDDSPAIVWIKDLNGRYLRINRRYTERLGIDGASIAGKCDAELLAEQVVEAPRLLGHRGATGDPVQIEYTVEATQQREALTVLQFPLHGLDGAAKATCGVAASVAEAGIARSEAERLLRIERWAALSAAAIRAEVLDEWQLAEVSATEPDGAEQPASGSPPGPADSTPSAATGTNELERLREQLAAALSATAKLDTRLAAERAARAELETRLGEEGARAANLHEAFADATRRTHKLVNGAAAERSQLVALEVAVQEGRARAESAERELAAARQRADDAERELIAARKRVEAADLELADGLERADAAERGLAEEHQRADAAERGLAEEHQRADAAERELAAALERAQAAEPEVAGERARADAAERELAAARRRAEAAEPELAAERARADTAEREVAAARDRVRAVEPELAAERERADRAEREVGAVRERVDAAERELAAPCDRVEDVEQELAAQRERADAAERELAAARERAEAAERELAGAREQAEAAEPELAVERSRADGAERELSAVRERAEAAERELAGARARVEGLEHAMTEAAEQAEARAEVEHRAAEALRRADEAERSLAAERAEAAQARTELVARAEQAEAAIGEVRAVAERASAAARRGEAAAELSRAWAEGLESVLARAREVEAENRSALARARAEIASLQAALERTQAEREEAKESTREGAEARHERAVRPPQAVVGIGPLVWPPPGRPAQTPMAEPGPSRSKLRWGPTAQRALAASLAGATEWRTGLKDAIRVLGTEGGWDAVIAWCPDERAIALRCVAMWMSAPDQLRLFETATWQCRQSPATSHIGFAAAGDQPKWLGDLGQVKDAQFVAAAEVGMRAALLVPLRRQEETTGVLELLTRGPAAPDTEIASAVEAVALQLAHFEYLLRRGAQPHWRLGRL